MLALRIFLFAGLVAHKVLWEVMRVSGGHSNQPVKSRSMAVRLLKMSKIAVLAGLGAETLFLNVFPISKKPDRIRLFGTALYVVGLLIAMSARVQLGNSWANIEDRQMLPRQSLITNGLYKYVRHPIYLGDILLVTGLQLALNSWLFVSGIVLALVTFRQAAAEEAILSEALPGYESYTQRTKRLVPFIL
jgi:protein-S-isoprenylcysteine O-methyltransferase Ste14